jgi:hypothetical protein
MPIFWSRIFLQLFGQRDVLHRHAFELQPDLAELWSELGGQRLGELELVGRQVQERECRLAAMALLMFCSTRPRSWPSRSCTV